MTFSIYKDDQKIEAWVSDDNLVNLEISYDGNTSISQLITITESEFLELFDALKSQINNG